MALLLDYALDNGDFRVIFTKKEFNTTSTLDHPNGITLRSTVLSKLNDVSQDGFEINCNKIVTIAFLGSLSRYNIYLEFKKDILKLKYLF